MTSSTAKSSDELFSCLNFGEVHQNLDDEK